MIKRGLQIVTWRMFAFSLFAVVGAVVAELCPGEPKSEFLPAEA